MRTIFPILLASMLPLYAQIRTSGNAATAGACSPAVTGNNNTFTFTYCGGDPAENAKILKILEALARGENLTLDRLDEIREILLKPIAITVTDSTSIPAPAVGGHPRATVEFFTDEPVDRGQFEVACDRACAPVSACTLIGSNPSILASVADHSEIAEILLQRQLPALTRCRFTVESRDDNPIKVVSLTTSRSLSEKRSKGLKVEWLSSTKSSLGGDGDADGGRFRSRTVPLLSTAWPRRAVEHYASGTAAPTRLSLSLFPVARIDGIHAPA